MKWVPVGEKLPEFDQFVLWRNEVGNCFVAEIDKDDWDWWNGNTSNGAATMPKCTHWAQISDPTKSPEPNQDELWDEVQARGAVLWMIGGSITKLVDDLKSLYNISRK